MSLALALAAASRGRRSAERGSVDPQLLEAARNGDTVSVERLLKKGANLEDKDKYGWTALAAAHSAIDNNATMKVLLEKGGNIAAKNNEGDTPLILAASGGGCQDTKIVKLLLERGVDVGVKNDHRNTALTLATKKGRAATVRLLKKAMADPS